MVSCGGEKLTIYLNGKKLPFKDFRSYLGLFNGVTPLAAFERVDEWQEVFMGVSADQSFQKISFDSSIGITKCGGHVSHIADQIATKLILEW